MPGGQAYFNQLAADAISATMPVEWNFESLFTSSRFAVSLINGDHDYVDPGEIYWSGFAARAPLLNLSIIRDAEHSAWIDDPKAFDAALSNRRRMFVGANARSIAVVVKLD